MMEETIINAYLYWQGKVKKKQDIMDVTSDQLLIGAEIRITAGGSINRG